MKSYLHPLTLMPSPSTSGSPESELGTSRRPDDLGNYFRPQVATRTEALSPIVGLAAL